MNIKYKIGDHVWRAGFGSTDNYVTCPDCAGTKRLRVIMGDESVVSIACAGCSVGYDPPTGYVKTYERSGAAMHGIVCKIEVRGNGVEYGVGDAADASCYYSVKDTEIFDHRDAALAAAAILAAAANAAELAAIGRKEKDTRTWAWNAHYHRDCIRRAEKEIAYHTAKLNAAASHSREEKARAAIAQAGG